MTLGERIKACRQSAGMSQEKLAEKMGVSRQAVTKWESDQSAPSTEKLFQLAEVFGTTVDLLLTPKGESRTPAEQAYEIFREIEGRRAAHRRQGLRWAVLVCAVYLLFYLIGRCIWCRGADTTVMGWLLFAAPTGEHSYLFGWLVHQKLFWPSMALSAIPALWGKWRYAITTTAGFMIGFVAGVLFGPYPAGEAYGHGHYGWAIWGGVFLLSVLCGIVLEWLNKRREKAAV